MSLKIKSSEVRMSEFVRPSIELTGTWFAQIVDPKRCICKINSIRIADVCGFFEAKFSME